MYEELREWDKPLLELFLKKLGEYNVDTVVNTLKQKKVFTLCSGYSYDWTIWLTVQVSKTKENEKEIGIDLWKGVEVDGISDEIVESVSLKITEISKVLEEAKDLLKNLLKQKLSEKPPHYLKETQL